MTISVVQVIDNEGSNPGNVQEPNGISTTPKSALTNDPIIALTTCATYGGAHTARTLTSKLGTQFTLAADMIGGQGNLNSDQELALWYAPIAIAGDDVFLQKFTGGDDDYQALWAAQVKGLGKLLLPAQASHQDNVAPGAGVLNAGAPFEITATMCPCVIVIASACISELGKHYTPSTGANVAHWGDWWKFAGEGDGGNNLCVGVMTVTTPGNYQPTCNAQSTVAEYYQTMAAVFADISSVTVAPVADYAIPITAAQVAHLAAGGAVTLVPTG